MCFYSRKTVKISQIFCRLKLLRVYIIQIAIKSLDNSPGACCIVIASSCVELVMPVYILTGLQLC